MQLSRSRTCQLWVLYVCLLGSIGAAPARALPIPSPTLPLQGVKLPPPLIDKYRRALGIYLLAHLAGDSLWTAESCYRFGKIQMGMGSPLAARRWFLRALRIWEAHDSHESLVKGYIQLSGVYGLLLQHREALQLSHLALNAARRQTDPHPLMSAYLHVGGMHQTLAGLGDRQCATDSARHYHRLALRYARKLNDPEQVANARLMLRELSAGKKRRPVDDIEHLTSMVWYSDSIHHEFNRVVLRVHLALACARQRKPRQALAILSAARQLAAESRQDSPPMQLVLAEGFAAAHETAGYYRQALAQQKLISQLRQQLAHADYDGANSRLSLAQEIEQRETVLNAHREELAQRTKAQRLQQRLTYATGALLVLALGTGAVFWVLFRKNRRIRYLNAQLVQEQSHRVKNNLQVVSSYLSLQSGRLHDETARRAVEESQLRLDAVSLLHRHLSEGSQLVAVNPAEFVPQLIADVLRTYGFDQLQPAYDLSRNLLHADQAVPLALLLTELTTNACKYAFPDHPTPVLTIHLTDHDGC